HEVEETRIKKTCRSTVYSTLALRLRRTVCWPPRATGSASASAFERACEHVADRKTRSEIKGLFIPRKKHWLKAQPVAPEQTLVTRQCHPESDGEERAFTPARDTRRCGCRLSRLRLRPGSQALAR